MSCLGSAENKKVMGDMSNPDKNSIKNILHAIQLDINSTCSSGNSIPDETNMFNFKRFRKYMDNQLIPDRIESSIVIANLMAEQNDLLYKNDTLSEYQKTQIKIIDRIISDFFNKTYSSIRTFQSLDYKINEKNFQIRYIKYAFMLISFIFLLLGFSFMGTLGPYGEQIVFVFSIVLLLIYSLFLFLNIKQNMNRYKYDWEKLYWNNPDNDQAKDRKCTLF